MDKFLRKWVRRSHRWMVLPFIAMILTVIIARGTQVGDVAQRFQSIFLIYMAVTGAYLYLLPYWSKWRRARAQR